MATLTTEELLFAHRVGASHIDVGWPTFFYKPEGSGWRFYKYGDVECQPYIFEHPALDGGAVEIDFTPLYDWMEHDGGECPVLPGDIVNVNHIEGWYKAYFLNWSEVKQFKLYRSEDWPEQRADSIGQNGNDGEHYDIPPPEYDPRDVAFKSPAKSKYHREIAPGIWVDVYDVLKAWGVENPALQHLIKKALQPGDRGHKTLEQDMNDIIASAKRAKELI